MKIDNQAAMKRGSSLQFSVLSLTVMCISLIKAKGYEQVLPAVMD